MKKKISINGDLIFLFVILALGAFICILSMVQFRDLHYKVKTFPLWTSMALIVLCGIEAVSMWVKHRRSLATGAAEQKRETKWSAKSKNIGGIFLGFLWMLAIPVGVMFFGFYITLPLFALIFLRSNSVGWIPCLITAVFVFLITYFGFGEGLRLRLYEGLIYHLLLR